MIRWITTGIARVPWRLLPASRSMSTSPPPPRKKPRTGSSRTSGARKRPASRRKEHVDRSPSHGLVVAALQGVLDFVVPVANAQADIDVSSPPIRALTASMKARAADLDSFFTSGAIGLTSDGLVEIRDANSVPLADRNRLRKLVSDDNADRAAL